jgi:hypothetical protein
MRYRTLIVSSLILVLTVNGNTAFAAGQKEAKLYWDELLNAILHERIAVNLPDMTRVEGKVLAVHQDSLDIAVQKTSDARLHPKGVMTIPRSSLSSFELHAKRHYDSNSDIRSGEEAGATMGALAGIPLAAAVAGHDEGRGYLAFVGSMITGMALGGLVATRTDTETILIQIIPEPPSSPSAVTPSASATGNLQQNNSGSLSPNQAAAAPLPQGTRPNGLIRRGSQPNAADNGTDSARQNWPVVPSRTMDNQAF